MVYRLACTALCYYCLIHFFERGHLYQLTDARKALNLWTGPTALSRALSTLLNGLEGCMHCTVLLLLDSLLWEGTFVPTYWRTQGSKPLDRAYGPVQSFEYPAEHSNRAFAWFTSSRDHIVASNSFHLQELELWTRWVRKFFTFKYLWHSTRKRRLVEKKRKWKVKYTLEELIEDIRSLSDFFSFWWLRNHSRWLRVYLKKKRIFSLTDQIPLNKLFQSKFRFPFPLFSNKSTFLYSYGPTIKN
jgi:hypothetical protein